MTCCCFWFSQPAMETTRNENGSRPARIRRDYHVNAFRLSETQIELLDITGVRRRATAVVGIDTPLGWHMVCARLREGCAGSRLANQRRPVTFSRYVSAKAALCLTHVSSSGCLVSHLYRDCRTPRGQTLASWNIHPNATRGTQCHGGSVERFGGRAIHQPQYRMKIPNLNLSPHIRSFGLTI